jgi:hypothetical protein
MMVKKVSLAIWIVGALLVVAVLAYSGGKFGDYAAQAIVFEMLLLAIGLVAGMRIERHRRH